MSGDRPFYRRPVDNPITTCGFQRTIGLAGPKIRLPALLLLGHNWIMNKCALTATVSMNLPILRFRPCGFPLSAAFLGASLRQSRQTANPPAIAPATHRFSPFSDRFRTVFQPFTDRFSPFFPFSKNRQPTARRWHAARPTLPNEKSTQRNGKVLKDAAGLLSALY